MTQNISNQFNPNMSFRALENYVRDNIENENDKSVLNIDGNGSFQVSTTDARYALTRSDADKKANTATRKAVIDALKGYGLDMNSLSDDMKKAMKLDDFEMKQGQVTSTHPLSAMRLKAIVTQAKKELQSVIAKQVAAHNKEGKKNIEDFMTISTQLDKEASAIVNDLKADGVTETRIRQLVSSFTMLTQKQDPHEIEAGMVVLKQTLEQLTKDFASPSMMLDNFAKFVAKVHDNIVRYCPALKDYPNFAEPFKDFISETVACSFVNQETVKQYHANFLIHLRDLPQLENMSPEDENINKCENKASYDEAMRFKEINNALNGKTIKYYLNMLFMDMKQVEQEAGGVDKMHDGYKKFVSDIHDKLLELRPGLKNYPGFEEHFKPYIQD